MPSDFVITRQAGNMQKPFITAWIMAMAFFATMSFSLAHAQGQAVNAPAAPLIIGFDESPTIFGTVWGLRIYAEAFKRLGISWKPRFYPLARRAVLVDDGTIDGEIARVYGYLAAHPNLVRVEESVMDLGFALYTANPALKLQRLEDLTSSAYLVEYRRGILLCETRLKQLVAPKRLSDVTTVRQGLKKLVAGRTDVYCDLEVAIPEAQRSLEFKDAAKIRKVIGLGTSATYPYLHKKHAALAPRLAEVLRQMKAEGLIEAYRMEAERESGAKQ